MPKKILLIAAALLLGLSFVFSYYFTAKPSVIVEQNSLQHYIRKQQKDFHLLIQDSAFMRRLVQQRETLDEFRSMENKEYGVFLFVETLSGPNQILFWNNQKILPPSGDFSMADGEYFQQLANGYYAFEKRTITLSGISSNVIAYAMIPVISKYDIESEYFYTHFAHSRDAVKKISISQTPTDHPVKSLGGKTLFYIQHKAHTAIVAKDTVTIALRLTAFLLLLLYVHFLADALTRRKGLLYGISLLVFILIVIRLLIYFFPAVFYFRQFPLFDPSVYAANLFNRSLGDLLLNTVMLCWVVLFAWFHTGLVKKLPSFFNNRLLVATGIISLLLLILATFELADMVRSLVANSKISFYVTDFFSLGFFTVVGFVVLALLSLTYYYFTRLLFKFIQAAFPNKLYVYFLVAFLGLIILSLRNGSAMVLFYLPVLLWLVIYTFLFCQQRLVINRFRISIAGILFWIFIFSVSLSAIILKENQNKEWLTRMAIAEKYDQLTDPTNERTLSIGLRYLDNRFLRNNYERFKNAEQNKILRDSIIRENISIGYTNTYNTKIYVFDSTNMPVNNGDSVSYAELNNIFTVQSRPTGLEDLYYHETSFDQFTYITKRNITDTLDTIGSFFIVSTPKKFNSDALYPELLRQINKGDPENAPIYSYAIYKNNFLVSAANKYPFRTSLMPGEVPKAEYQKVVSGDHDELWYKANSNKIVVVAKKRNGLIESITLFSYLFCAFIFMIALIKLIALVLKAGHNFKALNDFWQVSIRSQVHSTIIFVSVVSFLIIGVATISFFIQRYNRNNIDKLSRTAAIMVKEMQKKMEGGRLLSDDFYGADTTTGYALQNLVNDVADIHNVDVNVYDLDGNLQVTSNAEVYSKGILSAKMHPEAFYHLNRLRQVQYVQEETMSTLRYLSIYAAVRDENGKVHKYLNIPYFLSQVDLNQEISNFLVTIINLNAFIFLIAGTVALFITNKITRSFSVIGDKMKAITLGKTNEKIEWKRNDEIGELVTQYNKMVRQLEESAAALAKSEREGAWREMARQVAHEIKNPLTPMKLSIQYLQKAINNNHDNVKELTTNVANTLVEQIDHLSKIAADFARFANIGNRKLEIFDLHGVLEGLKELYNANPNVNVSWSRVESEIVMKADKTHMNRLFTNLISNAIEACNEQAACSIAISETMQDNCVLIEIKDNGEGIPEEMQPKIFTPNFTTKTSGTGLGLAMSKSIVEQAGGTIWFNTEQGVGTSFFVSLPIME